uniref:Uncharacterized protein n=1 Tax=Rhizophora mucronata TaxID=61149 RepID=A0A2P2JHC3_RHIMU
MLQNSLDDTTTIGMSGECDNLTLKSRNNKFNIICWYTFYTLLYYMISILIMYTSHNMPIKLLHEMDFLIMLNHFKGLLYHTTTIHLQTQLQNMSSKFICKFLSVFGTSMIKKLLNNIISKHICH